MKFQWIRSCAMAWALLGFGLNAFAGEVVEHSIPGSPLKIFSETDTVSDASDLPFEINRVVRADVAADPSLATGVIILLPPSFCSFHCYEFGVDGEAYTTSLAGYLASLGIDVYGYSPRQSLVSQEDYDADPTGIESAMVNVGMATLVEDVNGAVLNKVREIHGASVKPAVGGWSAGAISAFPVVSDNPQAYSGMFLYEGIGFSENDAIQEVNQTHATYNCNGLSAKVADGDAADEATLASYLALSQGPLFHFGFSLEQDAFVPGYAYFTGNARDFRFADENRVLALLDVMAQSPIDSFSFIRDYVCAFAGEPAFFDLYYSGLSEFSGRVMMIAAQNGFGQYMLQNLADFGISSDRVHWDPAKTNFLQSSHGDAWMRPDHLEVLEKPLATWLSGLIYR